MTGLLGKSSSPGVKGDNWVSIGEVKWDSDFFYLGTQYVVVDPDFRDDLGFVPRKNIRKFSPQIAILPRPNSRLIRQFRIAFLSDYTMNQKNELETRVNHYTFGVSFQSGDTLLWTPHTRLERLRIPFEIRPGVVIPTETYSWWYNGIRYTANPGRKLSGFFNWKREYGFFGGDLHNLEINPRLKLGEKLSVEAGYQLNKATFPQGKFTDHTVNTRVNYNFNNQWLTSTTMQYSNTDSFLGFNFRLNYIFRPGDDFFLVYNEGRRDEIFTEPEHTVAMLDRRKDRSLQLKLTYSFDY